MKIVFYRHSLLNRGGDKVVLTYANFLADNGHDVAVYVNVIDTVFSISENVKLQRMKIIGPYGTLLRALFVPVRADIVVADVITITVALFVRNRRRILYLAQDYDVFYYRNSLMRFVMHVLYKIGLGLFKVPVVAESEKLGGELAVYAKDITVVENGIDPGVFYPEPDRELLSLKKERKAILCFKRGDYRKGFDVLLETLALLQNEVEKESVELWVMGENLKAGVAPFPVRNFGYVPQDKVRKILGSADVFVYPTRHEGFGLLVFEAMACRCPVVTTKAVPIVEHLKQAWLADAGDARSLKEGVLAVLQNEGLREELVKNGSATARALTSDRSQRMLIEYLNGLSQRMGK